MQVEEDDGQGGEEFRCRHGEPYSGGAEQAGEEDEAGEEEEDASEEGEEGCGFYLFGALVVADGGEVEDEEDEAGGEVGQAVGGDWGGGGVEVDEEAGEVGGEEGEGEGDGYAAEEGGLEGYAFGVADAVVVAAAVVVADDGLGGLGYGVAYHEDEGGVVAGDAECAYAVVAEVVDEDLVADEHEGCHGGFVEEGGGADAALVADVAEGEAEAFAAHFQAVEAQVAGMAGEVEDGYDGADADGDGGGEGCSHDAPVEGEDEEPVEEDVDGGGYDAAEHDEFGGAVEADEEGAYGGPDGEEEGGGEPEHVVGDEGEEVVGGSEEARGVVGECHGGYGGEEGDEGGEEECLGGVDACGFLPAPGEVDGGDDGASCSGHEFYAGEEHEDGYHDVDGGYAVAAYSVSDEDAVDGCEQADAEHSGEGGDEVFPEEPGDVCCAEVECVSVHFVFVVLCVVCLRVLLFWGCFVGFLCGVSPLEMWSHSTGDVESLHKWCGVTPLRGWGMCWFLGVSLGGRCRVCRLSVVRRRAGCRSGWL